MDTKTAFALHLLARFIKPQGFTKRIAEAHVNKPTLLERHQQRHVVEVWAENACGIRNCGREHSNVETQGAQQGGEQTVAFVTETTALAFNDLAEESFIFKHDRLFGVDAEILKGHGQQMRNLQRSQGLSSRKK